ncbi:MULTISPECIES: hypothetical protein [unclassified Sphingopyxis]|uniref:hypothetical protein n=1 Tax=unclassified Sphingopyxis TaxID=2614943 RepID=UPI00073BA7FA|nr:hypothetical protein [Sphingopyxis sp. A083]KTE75068.1 hypothetical protein ATE59_14535 [Sphingopyxis sp. A083]
MFQNKGSSFPLGRDLLTDAEFTQVIASALKIEFGSTRNGAKMLMRWTGVSSRTAKNWLSGSHAPSGVHLVLIARQSNAVLKAIMLMAERPEMSLGASLISLRRILEETISALDEVML